MGPHHSRGVWRPSKACCAPIKGLTTALYGLTGPIPRAARLDRPSCSGLGWSCARTPPPAQKEVALVLGQLYPNRNIGVANGVGLDHPAKHGPDAELLLQGPATNLGAAPCPERAMTLIQAAAGRPQTMIRKAATALPSTHLPLSHLPAWYATLPARGGDGSGGRWAATRARCGAGAHGRRNRFCLRGPALRRAVMVLIQPERGYDATRAFSYSLSSDLPPTHAYLALYLWDAAGGRPASW